MSISASWRAQQPITGASDVAESSQTAGSTSDGRATDGRASFQRDSLVWAFGKLAERAVRHFLRDASARARYARWLSEEHGEDAAGLEQSLLLVGLELGTDGCVRLEARPTRGQFLLLAQHPRFHAVVALSHLALSARQQCDGICLADFEGDAERATRWALGLNTWLSKRWSTRGEARPVALN